MDQSKAFGTVWKPEVCKSPSTGVDYRTNLPIVTGAVVTFITKQEQNPK